MADSMVRLELLIERYPILTPVREAVWEAFVLMRDCYCAGGKLLTAGNGGSAADAEHIVGELMKSFMLPRRLDEQAESRLRKDGGRYGAVLADSLQKSLPAIALTGQLSLTTAVSNDIGPNFTFAQQLFGYGKAGDLFMAISTSGNSENLLYAAATAKALGIQVIGLTGISGGKLNDLADLMIRIPEKETYLVQELHLPVYHCLCAMLEECFFQSY